MEDNKEVSKPCAIDLDDVNLKNPFVVLRQYQGRMVSTSAKAKWKALGYKDSIGEYVTQIVKQMYET